MNRTTSIVCAQSGGKSAYAACSGCSSNGRSQNFQQPLRPRRSRLSCACADRLSARWLRSTYLGLTRFMRRRVRRRRCASARSARGIARAQASKAARSRNRSRTRRRRRRRRLSKRARRRKVMREVDAVGCHAAQQVVDRAASSSSVARRRPSLARSSASIARGKTRLVGLEPAQRRARASPISGSSACASA